MRTVDGQLVEIGPAEGLPDQSVVNCDNLITIPVALLDSEPVGHLDLNSRIRLDQAVRYALDIQY